MIGRRRLMIHEEKFHDLLAPEDLHHHIPEHHGTEPVHVLQHLDHPDIESWMERHGIESAGDHDVDVLAMWHWQQHDDDERADEFVALVAEVIAGLAVPISLSLEVGGESRAAKLYGRALDPWRKVRDLLHVHGWKGPEEHERRIRHLLRKDEK